MLTASIDQLVFPNFRVARQTLQTLLVDRGKYETACSHGVSLRETGLRRETRNETSEIARISQIISRNWLTGWRAVQGNRGQICGKLDITNWK